MQKYSKYMYILSKLNSATSKASTARNTINIARQLLYASDPVYVKELYMHRIYKK